MIPAPEDDSPFCNRDRGNTTGLWSIDVTPLPPLPVSELLPLSTPKPSRNPTLLWFPTSFFFPDLERLLAPNTAVAPPFSPRKPKKLSCGNGPDLVFILFNPNDDAKIGETDAADVDDDGNGNSGNSFTVAGADFFDPDRIEISLSFPLTTSFFVFRLEAEVNLSEPPLPPPPLVEVPAAFRVWTMFDLGFFLSDLEGEFEEIDRGLFEEASGLEVSDFLEEKNLPLKTMFGWNNRLLNFLTLAAC